MADLRPSGGKKGGKGSRKPGPMSSDDAAAASGVGKIRDVLQDVLRAASSLQGNSEAEEELCREVSVAAARVLSRHNVQGAQKMLSANMPLSEEDLREKLRSEIASRLDTFQKELYNQNCFLQKVPSDVINDEQWRMWEQVLNRCLADAVQKGADDTIRWVRKLAEEKSVRLRDPLQEQKEHTLMGALARGLGAPGGVPSNQVTARVFDADAT